VLSPSPTTPAAQGRASLQLRRQVQEFSGRLLRLPVGKHPALLFNPQLEGYRDYTFGCRAGPSVSAVNGFHELAHAAQFGPDSFRYRATEAGFRFKTREIWIGSHHCLDPRTDQATRRELETLAHQLHLMHCAGYKVRPRPFFAKAVKAMWFMPDWYNVAGDDDQDRAKHCVAIAQEHFERLSGHSVLERLEGWLDHTAKRLSRRGKPRVPEDRYHSVLPRFHALGQAFD
jgi:hypothetical protein